MTDRRETMRTETQWDDLMTKTSIVAALAGFTAIALIGLWYHFGVEPGIPVWAEGDRAVQWERDRLPLKVTCESHADDCVAAVNLWNREVGCGLFHYTESAPGDVRIIDASANDPERGDAWEKTFASKTADRVNYVEIRVYEPAIGVNSSFSMQYAVISHALAHALGLAHTRTGITRAVQSDTDLSPRVLDKHRRAVRDRYCQ